MKYTHPDFDGTFPKPKGVWVEIDGQKVASKFFATSTPEKIAALGFVEYVEPEPEPIATVNNNILSAPQRGFGGPTGREVFYGNR